MISCYIDDLKIHDINDPVCPYFLHNDIDGLEFPTMRVSSFNRAGNDGIMISDVLLGERRFSLPGTAIGITDLTSFMNVRKQFIGLQSPIKDSNGKLIKRVIRFTMEDGNEYRILAQIVKVKFPQTYLLSSEFYIDCLADSLLIERNTLNTVSGGTPSANGFIVPVIVPIVTTGGTNGDITATNNGTYPVNPIITLSGVLTNPRIYNKTTNLLMQFNISLGISDSLVVDMENKTIILNGQTNKMNTKTTDSRFFNLQVGDNIINLTSGVSNESGTMSVEFRDGYLGV